MDTYIGEITLWPLTWAPQNWAFCDGSELSVAGNQTLYSLIGNSYGNASSSDKFKLPDLRSLVPLGAQAVSALGQKGGSATAGVIAGGTGSVTIGVQNLPSHTHVATFTPSAVSAMSIEIPVVPNPISNSATPSSQTSLAKIASDSSATLYSTDNPTDTLKPFPVQLPAGGGTVNLSSEGSVQTSVAVSVPVAASTLQPSLALNFIICVIGIYPAHA